MATSTGRAVIRHLRRAAVYSDEVEQSDESLLSEFIARRDEAAFAALVRRHGPMVLAVCRRVVGREADAEDAFQASFLVLARKAATLANPELLANWLFGVAYRTALEARTRMNRRFATELPLPEFAEPAIEPAEDNSEWLALLDREVSRLSDKYRVPVVMCELEGHSRREVAELLGIPEGTLSSRLAAARRLLADRLTRRGVAVSVGAVVAALSQSDAPAAVPAFLISSTVASATADAVPHAVAAISTGVLKTMFIHKLQRCALVLALIGVGTGAVTLGLVGGKPVAAMPDDKPKPRGDKTDDKPVGSASLQGGWKIVKMSVGGREMPANQGPGFQSMYFTKDKGYLLNKDGLGAGFTYTLDTEQKPAHINMKLTGEDSVGKNKLAGIYELSGDDLKLAFHDGQEADKRPESFAAKEDERTVVIVLKRDPKVKAPDPKTADAKITQARERMISSNNLKQMALAMHNYLDSYRSFPAAAICDKDGKPLLSWRVAILPYIEQDALYKEFKLDEPWDSDHNKKLMAQMPKVYGPKGTETHYRVFHGKGAAFEGTKGVGIADITDGTSNTILIVEGVDTVPWTKPDELTYDAEKPLPKLGGKPRANGFLAAMADGSVRMVSDKTPEKTIRAMITRNGGEVIEPEKDKE